VDTTFGSVVSIGKKSVSFIEIQWDKRGEAMDLSCEQKRSGGGNDGGGRQL
jgi:hypothetical protein